MVSHAAVLCEASEGIHRYAVPLSLQVVTKVSVDLGSLCLHMSSTVHRQDFCPLLKAGLNPSIYRMCYI